METVENLASYHRCTERIDGGWQWFRAQRLERLRERERFGHAAERATEAIVEDLFTGPLDWSIGDLNHQVGYADILLLGIKYLIVEAKRPGALAWNQAGVDTALAQARRYAAEQKVRCVAVTDGVMLYAADLVRLACAAGSLGRLPHQTTDTAPVYLQLVAALEQLDRIGEVPR